MGGAKMKTAWKKLCHTISNHKIIVLVCLILLGMCYIYYPRNVKSLLVKDYNIADINVVYTVADGKTDKDVALTQRQMAELMDAFSKSYARRKIIKKHSASKDVVGYLIQMSGSTDVVYFFTKRIISINGVQYEVYGESLSNQFLSIIESEE